MRGKLLILVSLFLIGCCGGSHEEDTNLKYIPVENCSDSLCNQCTSLFARNNVGVVCMPVLKCATTYCMYIIHTKMPNNTVGTYSKNGTMVVTTYQRTLQEVAETMAHEIGHSVGLPHHQVCNNIMAQDSACADVRTELEDWQRGYF